ncbi:nucleolar protein 11 [Prorops nasuta]|uniref:nucleolar protein 11 n=1 Tax=Prorops nasuta TaxID=863751 RepID=UPI0034CF982D
MAKLSSYYTLCPLIDQQNLLGVQRDSEPGCAIVTLGRNIVIRYKLQDLKQLGSWSSKDRLTAQVIYDNSTNKYAAVFNEKRVRVWTKEENDLNNVKGHKFHFPFHVILTLNDLPPVLVQQNGATASLQWALENKKTWSSKGILKPDEKIVDCQLISMNNKTSLFALTKLKENYKYITVELQDQTYLEDVNYLKRTELSRNSEQLIGHVVMQTKNNVCLLTLWSHGRLYSHPLLDDSAELGTCNLISVVDCINSAHPVVMTPLNDTTIAVYGADVSEEGAVLLIYNVQFKLVQAVQKLKLYTNDAKLWRVEDKLLLAANRHLAVAPYYLAPQRIETMLGSSLNFRKYNQNDDIVVVQQTTIANWGSELTKSRKPFSKVPKNISKQISSYINEGLSDAAIQKLLLPELIELKDIDAISWCLDTFIDLPEKLMTDLLAFSLRTSNKMLKPLQNGNTEENPDTNTVSIRNDFLNKILSISYLDVTLLSHLKMGLSFNEITQLLQYLIAKLGSQEEVFGYTEPNDKHLYDWASLLLDSHYQNYVLSQDSEVLTLFNKLYDVLNSHLKLMEDLKNLRPMISRTLNGKSIKLLHQNCNQFYSVEEIKLY